MKAKHLVLLLSLILSCAVLPAQEVFKNDEVTISKLEEGTWVVETFD